MEVSSELYVEQTHSANNNHVPAWRYGGETLIHRHPISADGKIANHVAKEKERVIISNPSAFQVKQSLAGLSVDVKTESHNRDRAT